MRWRKLKPSILVCATHGYPMCRCDWRRLLSSAIAIKSSIRRVKDSTIGKVSWFLTDPCSKLISTRPLPAEITLAGAIGQGIPAPMPGGHPRRSPMRWVTTQGADIVLIKMESILISVTTMARPKPICATEVGLFIIRHLMFSMLMVCH
ncbi:hypothetical protein D3C78_1169340 [compost metagenome]